MPSVPGVVVGDVSEVADPSVDAQEVERGGSEEEHRLGVGSEESANLGNAPQLSTGRCLIAH